MNYTCRQGSTLLLIMLMPTVATTLWYVCLTFTDKMLLHMPGL